MASGIHGWLQSLGTVWGPLPTTTAGTTRCPASWFHCTDAREHLGEASGVEVVVVRNPQAGVTSFSDLPEGLRVYNASDGGPGFLETLLTDPWDVGSRVTDAHLAVLDDPRVADCIVVEVTGSGTCPPCPGWARRLRRGSLCMGQGTL